MCGRPPLFCPWPDTRQDGQDKRGPPLLLVAVEDYLFLFFLLLREDLDETDSVHGHDDLRNVSAYVVGYSPVAPTGIREGYGDVARLGQPLRFGQ